ncbi:uncharacterized protein LOC113561094 [Rhopalosiphum maidis]|uniref:uncharacterized protein LOC113561094 n=1 Tax=Rhopalosiphum maidis TaxID=43146 RepID=UPI000EFF2F30|nr:uncharacterized protein LOC113561094 [Rhopalosiphum maidis]
MLVKYYYECRRRTVRRSANEYFCFLINNPRTVCRIMSMMILVILSSLSTDYVLQVLNAQKINLKNNDFANPSLHLDVEAELLQINMSLKNFNKIFRFFVCHLGYVSIFLFANVLLLKATYKRNLQSIKIWLFVHISHMTYSLSINVWIGIYKNSYCLLTLTVFNTILYLLFISLVILFWMNERYFRCVHERAAVLRRRRTMAL